MRVSRHNFIPVPGNKLAGGQCHKYNADMTRKKAPKLPEAGPRGGRTTISKSGMMRKAINLHHDEWEKLRWLSYQENRPASDIVREALRMYFRASERKG